MKRFLLSVFVMEIFWLHSKRCIDHCRMEWTGWHFLPATSCMAFYVMTWVLAKHCRLCAYLLVITTDEHRHFRFGIYCCSTDIPGRFKMFGKCRVTLIVCSNDTWQNAFALHWNDFNPLSLEMLTFRFAGLNFEYDVYKYLSDSCFFTYSNCQITLHKCISFSNIFVI